MGAGVSDRLHPEAPLEQGQPRNSQQREAGWLMGCSCSGGAGWASGQPCLAEDQAALLHPPSLQARVQEEASLCGTPRAGVRAPLMVLQTGRQKAPVRGGDGV